MIRRIMFDNAYEYFNLPNVEGDSQPPAAHAQARRI